MSWRRWALLSLPLAGLLLAIGSMCISLTGPGHASQADPAPKKKPDGPDLPMRQVVLFNSGVGYFQREGDVDGDAKVTLSFPTSEINDLLKSLILQDTQGQVGTVSYDSQDPIDRILHSFALDLNNNPSFAQILNQARGEKIELTRIEKKDAQPTKLAGTIVGVEVARRLTPKDQILEEGVVNLLTAAGLQGISLEQVVAVHFNNPTLESEFQRALQVLALSHDTQKKTVTVAFNGAGKRPVRVGYVVERPIWKTTYRLRLEPNQKIGLQGWALVENTSDDDWNDVRMVLVSGRPISYKMDLYEPLYIPRPTVEPEMFASLRPPVYGGAMTAMPGDQQAAMEGKNIDPQGRAPGQGGAGMNGAGSPPMQGRLQFAPVFVNPNMQWAIPNNALQNGGLNLGNGMGGGGFQGGGLNMGNGFNIGGGFAGQGPTNFSNGQQQQIQNRLSYDELQKRREQLREARDQAKKAGPALTALNFKEGIASVATAEEVGDYYRYVIDQKVSLARQKSAMLPILDQSVDGQKVSIYNHATQPRYPLLGLKLKNTSGKPLTQGPITVYDEGTYAGDTRILDLQPGEERLLSYALDQGTEVKIDTEAGTDPRISFSMHADHIVAHYRSRETNRFTIKNRSTHTREVIIEHPIRHDWALVDAKQAYEKTRDLYRFQLTVPAGKVVRYEVIEDQAKELSTPLAIGSRAIAHVDHSDVWLTVDRHVDEKKLLSLRIERGLVLPTYRVRESRTCFLENRSTKDGSYDFEQIIPKGWVRLKNAGESQPGPDAFKFTIEAKAGKTEKQEVVMQQTNEPDGMPLKELDATRVRGFMNSPIPSQPVKTALQTSLDQRARIAETRKELRGLEERFKLLVEDQARLRSNLGIIPQSSEHYKKFLDKFVTQETEIENLQRQIRQVQATLQSQEREHETFLAALKVE